MVWRRISLNSRECGVESEVRKSQGGFVNAAVAGFPSSSPQNPRRPRERGDPYRVIYQLGQVADACFTNQGRWLWVPACAGTTRGKINSFWPRAAASPW